MKSNPGVENSNIKRDRLAKIAKEIFAMRFSDETALDNYFLEEFMAEYIKILMPKLDYWFNTVWEHQKKNSASYGDIDVTITKYESTYIGELDPVMDQIMSNMNKDKGIIEKPGPPSKKDDKQMRVLFINDHVGCGEHTKFLIVQESISWALNNPGPAKEMSAKNLKEFEEFDEYKYHLRIVYDPGDYKKGSKYVSKPNLKWYKDRQFNIDYVENLHLTPLGGCYGDCRDDGYILSAEKERGSKKGEWKVEHQGLMAKFHLFKNICSWLTVAIYDLSEEENISNT